MPVVKVRSQQKLRRLWLMVVALGLIMSVLGIIGILRILDVRRPDTSADVVVNSNSWANMSPDERAEVAEKLVREGLLKSMSPEQLSILMGEPTSTARSMTYELAFGASLVLEFDSNWRVSRITGSRFQSDWNESFEIDDWRNGSIEIKTRMVPSLVRLDILKQKSKDDVERLLGVPTWKTMSLIYDLGAHHGGSRSRTPGRPHALCVSFNDKGLFRDAYLIEGS